MTKSHRRTSSAVGVLFLAAIVAYATGSALVESVFNGENHLQIIAANKSRIALGALAMFVNSIVVIGIGVLMLPVLRRSHPNVAYFYLSLRLVESIVLLFGVLSLLSIIGIAQQYALVENPNIAHFQTLAALAKNGNYYAYQLAMAALGIGSLGFCYAMLQSNLVPRMLALWGLAGYAVFTAGAISEILGYGHGILLSIPGGLFELFLGVWLIVKGFNPNTANLENTPSS